MSRPGLELSFLVVCTVQYILFLYTLAQPGSRHLSSANINVKLSTCNYQRATINVQPRVATIASGCLLTSLLTT